MNRVRVCYMCGKKSFGKLCRKCYCKDSGRTESRRRCEKKHNEMNRNKKI